MTDPTWLRPAITRYPASDAAFAESVESSLVSVGSPISDDRLLAAVEMLLHESYPLATFRGVRTQAGLQPTWEVFRDDIARDVEMLRRATSGDATAFEELYRRHSAHAFSLALRITSDRARAEEVVQEAFLDLWRTAARFDPSRSSLKSWLLTITHHRAVDAVRRRRAPTARLDEVIASPIMATQLRTPDVWPEVSARLDRDSVRRAVASLAESQRVALELAYFGGMTQAEIATQLNVPLGTVKSRVRLGLGRLVVVLADGDPGNDATEPSRSAKRLPTPEAITQLT